MKTKAIALTIVLLLSSTASSQIAREYYSSYSEWYRQRNYIKFAYLMGAMDILVTHGTREHSQPTYYSNCAGRLDLTNTQLPIHLHSYVTAHPTLQGGSVTGALVAYLQEVCG